MKATTANSIARKAVLRPILAEILKHARNGYFCRCFIDLPSEVIQDLKALGYKVDPGSAVGIYYVMW